MGLSDKEREEFEFRRNKPDFADQGDSDMSGSQWGSSDPYGSGGSLGSNDFSSSNSELGDFFKNSDDNPSEPNPFGNDSAFGGMGGVGGDPFGSPMGGNPFGQPNQQNTGRADSLGGVAEAMGKTALVNSAEAAKTFTKSLSSANSKVFNKSAYFVTTVGAGYTALVVLIMILSLFAGFKNTGSLLIGGILASGLGLLVLSMTQEATKKHEEEELDLSVEDPPDGYQEINEDIPEHNTSSYFDTADTSTETTESSSNSDWWSDDSDDEEDEDEEWGDGYEEDDDTPAPPMELDEAKKSVDTMPEGMYTRQFLLEQFMTILPKINPYFSDWTEHDIDDDDEVVEFEGWLVEVAQDVMGLKDASEIQIVEMRSNEFMYEITLTRPGKADINKFAQEFKDIYASRKARDEYGQPSDTVYTRVRTSGSQLTISLFKGNGGGMVSIADALTEKKVKDMFLDTDIKMPLILGVNERGVVNKTDFAEIYSALLSGMPRKGKSWLVLAILAQLCAFNSPKEVTFYIGDNKDYTSDFYGLHLPHIKQFEGKNDRILKMLKWVVEEEGPRRKRLIGDVGGDVNYNNYIKSNPEAVEEMPRMYIIIDEMMALANSFNDDKSQKSQYFGYLETIVSQYPGLGIYFFGIPHRVKNDTIPKNVYSLIPFNINVAGDVEDVTDALSCKPAQFPYNLSQVGETGAKVSEINNGNPFYNKGIVISKSKDYNDKVFEFIRYMWYKVDHEFYHGPRIDMHDMKKDRFDNYECGCKSHGGIKTLPIEGFSSKNSKNPVQNPFKSGRVNPAGVSDSHNNPRGGFIQNDAQEDIASGSSTRLDGRRNIRDVSEDWNISGLDG